MERGVRVHTPDHRHSVHIIIDDDERRSEFRRQALAHRIVVGGDDGIAAPPRRADGIPHTRNYSWRGSQGEGLEGCKSGVFSLFSH